MSLIDDWYQPKLTARTALLLPAAQIYGAAIKFRRAFASKVSSLPMPVVVIGNVTVGGTGKTPLTLFLARALAAKNCAVGIVSRGYPMSPKSPLIVTAHSRSEACGDEPLLYAQAGFPTVVCASRVAAAQKLIESAPQVSIVLADDALQHHALGRDISICVIDATRGFGNGRLLPAGPLREPVARVQACDAVVVNGATSQRFHPQQFTMEIKITGFRSIQGHAGFPVKPTALVAGIGNPARFFAAVRKSAPQVLIAGEFAFPDHFAFTAQALNALPGEAIIITEKDAVKITEIAPQVRKEIWISQTQTLLAPDLVEWLLSRLAETRATHIE